MIITEVQGLYAALLGALLRAELFEAAEELKEWADSNDIFSDETEDNDAEFPL